MKKFTNSQLLNTNSTKKSYFCSLIQRGYTLDNLQTRKLYNAENQKHCHHRSR